MIWSFICQDHPWAIQFFRMRLRSIDIWGLWYDTIWKCKSCDVDLLKFLHGFVKVIHYSRPSRPTSPWYFPPELVAKCLPEWPAQTVSMLVFTYEGLGVLLDISIVRDRVISYDVLPNISKLEEFVCVDHSEKQTLRLWTNTVSPSHMLGQLTVDF